MITTLDAWYYSSFMSNSVSFEHIKQNPAEAEELRRAILSALTSGGEKDIDGERGI